MLLEYPVKSHRWSRDTRAHGRTHGHTVHVRVRRRARPRCVTRACACGSSVAAQRASRETFPRGAHGTLVRSTNCALRAVGTDFGESDGLRFGHILRVSVIQSVPWSVPRSYSKNARKRGFRALLLFSCTVPCARSSRGRQLTAFLHVHVHRCRHPCRPSTMQSVHPVRW